MEEGFCLYLVKRFSCKASFIAIIIYISCSMTSVCPGLSLVSIQQCRGSLLSNLIRNLMQFELFPIVKPHEAINYLFRPYYTQYIMHALTVSIELGIHSVWVAQMRYAIKTDLSVSVQSLASLDIFVFSDYGLSCIMGLALFFCVAK